MLVVVFCRGLAAALVLGLVAPAPASELDDVRSTELRLADWLRVAPGDRPWFVAGFALGWHGEAPATPPLALAETLAAQAPVIAALDRRAGLADAANPRLAVLLLRAAAAGRLPPPAPSGDDWLGLDPSRRFALLSGFHGGSYARALWRGLDGAADAAALDAAFAGARRRVRPWLALAPSLLFARLSDYYFITDRQDEPLLVSIRTIVDEVRAP
ncbi:MAG: hypothetical protein ACE5H8_00650 [Alphaproteobacteria bacterium]